MVLPRSDQEVSVQNISDTAAWVAHFRIRETQRPDALFRDPYAERLAGERGLRLANSLADGNKHEWAWTARTYLFDQFVHQEIQRGAELVLNLAAGLDARPYRMNLRPNLQWVEVDFPEIISHKEQILRNDRPRCQLERVRLNLADVPARRKLFFDLNLMAKKTVVMTEGLLIYLADTEVGTFASDLAGMTSFHSWIIDLASPGQLNLMQATSGRQLSKVGASFKFGPSEGPDFFLPYGWAATSVEGLLKTAAKFKRSPAGLLPLNTDGRNLPRNYPWTGVCLLERSERTKLNAAR